MEYTIKRPNAIGINWGQIWTKSGTVLGECKIGLW